MSASVPHERPPPPRRLPRVLPTPSKPAPAATTHTGLPQGLHRAIYDESLYALTHAGTRPMDALSATAVALTIARRVMARYTAERKV